MLTPSCNVEEDPLFCPSLFLLQEGEMSLLKGDLTKGLELFDSASKNDPENSDLFFRQALALFHYSNEKDKEKALLHAHKKLKIAAAKATPTFALLHIWGLVLTQLGAYAENHSYFTEAHHKFLRAQEHALQQPNDILADFYWDVGAVRIKLAEHSGEALDWQLALDVFSKASEMHEDLPAPFWHDFGYACTKLAMCINDIRLHVKAINCFKHSLRLVPSTYATWLILGKTLYALYEHTHDEDHFSQATECFASGSQLEPQNITLWLEWAHCLINSGRRTRDLKKLRACIEKCHKVYVCDQNEPMHKAFWGEALALLGESSERLDLIYEGQNKILEAIEVDPNIPELWHAHGMCLCALASYFHDVDYYYQAIEKLQYGLSLDRTSDELWHAMAQVYTLVGALETDKDAFDKASRFFTKAIDLHPSTYYIFDYGLSLSRLGEITHEQKELELALVQFEKALSIQKNASYLHPDWLYHYAYTLDMLGDFYEEDNYYIRAIDIFSHILMLDPDFPQLHHRLALAEAHLAELLGDLDHFYKAIHHFRLAAKQEEESDLVILDWGVCLINIAEHSQDTKDRELFYEEAEYKLIQAARLGNIHAHYYLAGLYSLLCQYEKAMYHLDRANLSGSLPPIEEVLEDDWLDGLRHTTQFSAFIAELEKKPNLHE